MLGKAFIYSIQDSRGADEIVAILTFSARNRHSLAGYPTAWKAATASRLVEDWRFLRAVGWIWAPLGG